MSTPRKVLVTGAAGRLGSFLSERLTERFETLASDVRAPAMASRSAFIRADITDLEAVRGLCSGRDTVVHFAASSDPTSEWSQLLSTNVIGAYNLFQAASESGCRRVVFASSGHAVLGYPDEPPVSPARPPYPITLYGATKVWGEALGRVYSARNGLSCICLRLGWVRSHSEMREQGRHDALNMVLSLEDLLRLVVCAIEAPDDLKYGVFFGLSNNRRTRWDISETRAALSYEPADDPFEIAGA